MNRIIIFLVTVFMIPACSGLSISPLSPTQANALHTSENSQKGYLVYAPMVVVEISQKEICVQKNERGNCVKVETKCSAGKPFTLPDYEKPYLVNINSGFGKTAVDVEIENGWMLGSVNDESNNAVLLSEARELFELVQPSLSNINTENGSSGIKRCRQPGIYKVDITNSGTSLTILEPYFEN